MKRGLGDLNMVASLYHRLPLRTSYRPSTCTIVRRKPHGSGEGKGPPRSSRDGPFTWHCTFSPDASVCRSRAVGAGTSTSRSSLELRVSPERRVPAAGPPLGAAPVAGSPACRGLPRAVPRLVGVVVPAPVVVPRLPAQAWPWTQVEPLVPFSQPPGTGGATCPSWTPRCGHWADRRPRARSRAWWPGSCSPGSSCRRRHPNG